jgi:hypothetical protein
MAGFFIGVSWDEKFILKAQLVRGVPPPARNSRPGLMAGFFIGFRWDEKFILTAQLVRGVLRPHGIRDPV